jgi:hypothetical protein
MTVILMLFVFGVFILVEYLTGPKKDIRCFDHTSDGLFQNGCYTMADGGEKIKNPPHNGQ